MIHKPLWLWKGIPENFKEFREEVFVLWFLSAMILGVTIALIIKFIFEFILMW